MTIEDAFAEVARRGLLVNNLFQLNSGQWRASLRAPGLNAPTYMFANAETPTAAMRKALDAAPGKEIGGFAGTAEGALQHAMQRVDAAAEKAAEPETDIFG